MGARVRLEFISDGFKEVLESDGVKSLVESKAEAIAAGARSNMVGDGDVTTDSKIGNYGGGRWIARVHCPESEESEHKALSRAVK